MKKKLLLYFTFIWLIFFISVGCADREYIRKTVNEEMKREMKEVTDFLNLAYGYNAYKRGLRNGSITPDDIKNLKNLSEKADGGVVDLEEINKKIAYELSKLDQQIEFKLIQVDNKVDVIIDRKLSKVEENIQDNRAQIKETKLDIKSNRIDITGNKMNIKGNSRDINTNRKNIHEQKEDILEDIDKNQKNIASNRKDIHSLKRSSEKLLLNINKAK
jgi:chromosome segregation ATPase